MSGSSRRVKVRGIDKVTVSGFKSIKEKRSIEIAPLTILAGANSSGKSSIMQPLLLLKQTLEAPYDPGALLLSGPNIRFTSSKQILSAAANSRESAAQQFSIGLGVGGETFVELCFAPRRGNQGFSVKELSVLHRGQQYTLTDEMPEEKLLETQGVVNDEIKDIVREFGKQGQPCKLSVGRERCFLTLNVHIGDFKLPLLPFSTGVPIVEGEIRRIIHIPGLRGNPARTYMRSAVANYFPGTFDQYVASVISEWQASRDQSQLTQLNEWLERLGLTWKVRAKALNDTQVELRVGRLSHGRRSSPKDTVSIADVGFGVSQCLPILVALLAARPGQLVYIEQPELHLHPNAQVRLAEVFIEAAARRVRLVVETHSSLLLRAVQLAVAKGRLAPTDVRLHWFHRDDKTGTTDIATTALDEAGTYGDWPADFDEVAMKVEMEFLNAAEERVLGE